MNNNSKITKKPGIRALSTGILAIIIVGCIVGSIILGASGNPDNIQSGEGKEYINYIIRQINDPDNVKDTFNILEIVPDMGISEFTYYLGDNRVTEGIKQAMYDNPQKNYISGANGYGKSYEFLRINNPFYNFSYEVMYRENENEYIIRSKKLFISRVIKEYAYELEGKINLEIREACELTAEEVQAADLIIINHRDHDGKTINCYEYWTGTKVKENYDKDGNILNKNQISFDTFFKDEKENLVSRDADWDSIKALLDVCITGKTININGEDIVLKVPVIMDSPDNYQNKTTSGDSGNMYKFITLERMLNSDLYSNIKSYFIKDGTLNKNGIETGVLKYEKDGIERNCVDLKVNDIWDFFGEGYYSNIYELSSPAVAHYLTDNYWVYDGSTVIIPSNVDILYYGSGVAGGFTEERVGKNPKTSNIIRYLLGLKNNNTATEKLNIDKKINILEIQPYNQFNYQSYANVKALADEMGYDTSVLTESNYKKYFNITSVSTNAFNSMNEDLVATYDIIYIGQLYKDVKTIDDNGKTIYNDKNLDGYVYLAFGDLVKVKNNLLGALETDYLKLNTKSNLYGLILTDKDGERDNNKALSLNRLYPAGTKKWNEYLNSKLETGQYYIINDINTTLKDITDLDQLYNIKLGNARYSGNDITEKKYNELVNYMNSGKVFLMEDNIYYGNSEFIYKTSNIYKFVEMAGLEKNDKTYTHKTSYKIPKAIENIIPEIIIKESPQQIEYDKNGLVNNHNPDQNTAEKEYQLRYVFNIKGQANASYNIKLILDKNGDGLYDTELKDDDTNEMYYETNVVLSADGDSEDIEMEATLPVELTGPIAWQIQVTQIISGKQTVIRALKTGYTAIEGLGKDVRVLQIIHATNPSDIKASEKNTLNMETNEKFQELLTKATQRINFNVKIECITTKEFEELYYYNGRETGYSIINDYNMVIIGFADAYGNDDISDDHGALTDIKKFIEAGKAVLFAHDTTSFIQTPNYFIGKGTESKVYAASLAQYNSGTFTGEETYSEEKGYGYYKESHAERILTYGDKLYSGELTFREIDLSRPVSQISKELVSDNIYNNGILNATYRKFATSASQLKDLNGNSIEKPEGDAIYYDSDGKKVIAVKLEQWMGENDYIKNRLVSVMGAVIEKISYTIDHNYWQQQVTEYFVYVYPYDCVCDEKLYTYKYRYENLGTLINGKRISSTGSNYDWAYNISNTFREELGMDRFGITLSEENRTGKNRPYYLSSKVAPSYTQTASDGKTYVEELQGITDMMIMWYSYISNKTIAKENNMYMLMPYKEVSYGKFPLTTNKVEKVNDGQITQYPYEINDTIKVAATHAQNYQLDLEDDELVVWYTLGKGSSTYYGDTLKDGGQNYYIYSKGNITYSGAGHSTITGDEEMKLFVNTIIRAMTSGNTPPKVVIDNGNRANDGSYIIYRNELDKKYEIYFTPKDSDLLSGIGLFKSGKITYNNKKTGESIILKEYSYGELVVGEQYKLEITQQNIMDAIGNEEAEFIFEVTDNYNATGVTKAVFKEKGLFELD